jgi:membrane dipeptidase
MPSTDAPRLARRSVLKRALAAAVALPMLNIGRYQVFAAEPRKYSARAIELIRRSLVIDMLAPLKLDFSTQAYAAALSEQEAENFRHSGITAFHNSIGLDELPTARADALAFLAAWQGYAGRNADVFSLAGRAADLDHAKAQRKVAVIMGLQSADHFGEPKDVKAFYELGLRCTQLTYNSQNRIGSGCTDRVDGGVSDFGVEIIKAMNEVGMLVDVSHCGDRTTLDAIEISPKAIAITHSNCRTLNNHPRLKTDEAIRKLAAKGGVIGITGVRNFVRDKEPTTVEHMVDHIDHVVKLVGIEHVGIGSDADLNGYDDMRPDELKKLKSSFKAIYAYRDKLDTDRFDHPQKIYDLTEALIGRGYSDSNIATILGGNFRRLLAATWT